MVPPHKKQKMNGDHKPKSTFSRPEKPEHSSKKGATSLRHKANQLLESRKLLPIWPHADEIRAAVRENDVLLLVGETGSGKSTQLPQFLCSEDWCQTQTTEDPSKVQSAAKPPKDSNARPKVGGRVAIIQPRRVAAISLATRVAAESGSLVGSASPASTVGYSVRFDNNVSPSTKIKFLTDGMLLQELLRDPWLKEYSCVIVDEVHERGINVDLALGFIRRILEAGKHDKDRDGRHGVPLKIVVMSATAEMVSIEGFFNDIESQQVNGAGVPADHSVEENEWSGFADDEDNPTTTGTAKSILDQSRIKVSSCFIKGRQYPVTVSYMPTPVTNLLDTAMERIINIHQHTPLPGDILVFLSGQEMIENLETLCHTYAHTLVENEKQQSQLLKKTQQPKLPALQILPLFASLPTHLQSRIFQPTPPFTRRIILATNIAETSITVPGIRHVIDTGKHKSRLFRPGLNLDTLLSTLISQSMAKQRTGRAGREAAGHCYRLYTQNDYFTLEKDTKPEILSTDLSFLVLTLKAHGVEDVLKFPLLTRPPARSLEAALEGLLSLDALDVDTGVITEIGKKMAMLPVRPDLARILLEATKYNKDVANGVIDIVSALSLEEGIFLPIRRGGNQISAKRRSQKSQVEDLLLPAKKLSSSHSKTNGAIVDAQGPDGEEHDSNSDSDSDSLSNPIETARRTLLSRHSDHLTLLNAVQAYSSPNTHDRRTWCNTHGVSHRAMSRIMDVRKQLRQMLESQRFRLPQKDSSSTPHTNSDGTVGAKTNSIPVEPSSINNSILKCLVTGLWTNIAIHSSIAPTQPQVQSTSTSTSTSISSSNNKNKTTATNPNQRAPYTTLLTNQPIHIHPSSVLFTVPRSNNRTNEDGSHNSSSRMNKSRGGSNGKGGTSNGTGNLPRAIVFTDLVYTSKAYARNVSGVDLSWVVEMGKIRV